MSDESNAPDEVEVVPDETEAGPPPPFRLEGSDGSQRGPFDSLELVQAAKANVTVVHDGENVVFTVRDANGEAV